MEKNDIKDLLSFIKQLGLNKIYIKTNDIELRINNNKVANINNSQQILSSEIPVMELNSEEVLQDNLIEVRSPMVGTFYRSPNPESEAFVNEGSMITKGQPLCIIEAMKIFNEVTSEVSGKVVKILVKDSSPIEYDQPLFLIEQQ